MNVDDYGRYHATAKSLNGALYPLRDDVKIRDIYGWLEECAAAGLIQFYIANGRDYLQVIDFNQRLRAMKSRFPEPESDAHLTAIPPSFGGHAAGRPRRKRVPETETKQKLETKQKRTTNGGQAASIAPIGASVILWPSFEDFWDAYGKKIDRSKCEGLWRKINQGGREKIMLHLQAYIPATPEIQFRKNPATYLRNQSWNDEIINNQQNGKQSSLTDTLLSGIAERLGGHHER